MNKLSLRYKIVKTCLKCGKIFIIKRNRNKTAKYCSFSCYEETFREIWKVSVMKRTGKHLTKEHRKKISDAHKLSGFMPPIMKGINHPQWKGGFSTTPEYNRERVKKRKALKKNGIGGNFSNDEWERLKKKWDYMCLCCKRYEPEIRLTQDHIIPLSKGGIHSIENIQPLCQSCNSRKHVNTNDYRIISNYIKI